MRLAPSRDTKNRVGASPTRSWRKNCYLARRWRYSARKSRVTELSTLTPGPIVEEKATDLT